MSLRDQLVAKGLVSGKEAKKIQRELKTERKKQAAERTSRAEVESREAARVEAQLQAAAQASAQAREQAAQVREAHEHLYRVKQVIEAHKLAGRGPVRFFHRVGQTSQLTSLMLPEALVRDLRGGRAAIACYDSAQGVRCCVVTRKAAEKLAQIEPNALVHWVTDSEGLHDPANAPARRTWEPDLRARRVFP